MLTIAARLWLTAYCADSATPSVVLVEAVITTSIVACGATAPAHSVSSTVSVSSPELCSPAAGPLWTSTGSLAGSPKKERKPWTSDSVMSERAMTAMVCPEPLVPPLRSGSRP